VEAVYIDTLGTYNPSLLQSLSAQYPSDDNVLDRIHLMRAFDMVTLIEACESIKASLSHLVPIELLVIDTIANPISLLMNKGQLQGTPISQPPYAGHALMQSFTHLLRLMTKEYNLATLLVNASVKVDANTQSAFSATKVKPALGVSWAFTADTCILMHRSVEEETVIVEVLRSRNGVNLS
jgi:RecA/RadA recombinase